MYTINDVTLRATPAGSLSALILQQSKTLFSLATWPGRAWYQDYLVPSLRGAGNVWTFFLPLEIDSGAFVVSDSISATALAAQAPEASSLPELLRRETGLPIETLARAIGVSKVTYHKWLNGAGISEESQERLRRVRSVLGSVLNMKPALRVFLHSSTPLGTPLHLLSQGKDATVLGLAAHGDALFVETAPPAEGPHRIRRIGWAESVDRDRLEDSYPPATLEENAIFDLESEPAICVSALFHR